MEISFDSPGRLPSQTLFPHATKQQHLVMLNIFHSKCFVANQERMWLILNNRITKESPTVSGTDYHNLSSTESPAQREVDAPCLDSSQAWFCRDLWVSKAGESKEEADSATVNLRKRAELKEELQMPKDEPKPLELRQEPNVDSDANAGSDYDAMPDSDVPLAEIPAPVSISNSLFRPARILVNPRCVTTYAGVSHTQLALDLFGTERDETGPRGGIGKYVLEDWDGAPESFVCQEQRYVKNNHDMLLAIDILWQTNGREEGHENAKTTQLFHPRRVNTTHLAFDHLLELCCKEFRRTWCPCLSRF
jgi:hypothetical protein